MVKKPLKILYTYEKRIPEKLRRLVRILIPEKEFGVIEITYGARKEEWIKKLREADILFGAPGRFIPDDLLGHAKKLKLVQLWSSGYDKFNVKGCTDLNIPVANNGGSNADSVAEHTILLMLAVYRKLPENHQRAVTGNWLGNSHGLDMFQLSQKKIGIIGFGKIGKLVAKKLSGFEAKVSYYDNDPAVQNKPAHGATFKPLKKLLRESDIVSLHLHYNVKTENLISRQKIEIMKKGAVIINVSRAQIINQTALYKNLKNRRLGGAGLDVFTEEPTRSNDPLMQLPNIVATPHIAGSTLDTYAIVMDRAVQNFRRIAAGKKPLWQINKTKPNSSKI